MNVQASVASENWDKLLSRIHRHECGVVQIELTDNEADRYDFANEVLMRRMREMLVAAIQGIVRNIHFDSAEILRAARYKKSLVLTFGNKFFMTMNEQQQRSFFQCIFNLGGCSVRVGEEDNSPESPAITISTSALLESLPQLHTSIHRLSISNFALTRSDVQALSNIILLKRATLLFLGIESIKCPVDDCLKQDNDEPNGMFDPLLHAASALNNFWLSAKTRSVHATLVSPMAVHALFVEREKKRIGKLRLNGLGLTDSHVLAIVDGLSTHGAHLKHLDLDSNPGITAQGYDALFNLINRANVIGCYYVLSGTWSGFRVDDKAWEGKLNMVSEMNSRYGRLEYLTNGSFSSEERRWEWLERVMDLPSKEREKVIVFETKHRKIVVDVLDGDGKMEIDDVKRVDFIYYILRENPEMMRT